MGWWARKRFKRERLRSAGAWASQERRERGYVMHMLRQDGRWVDVKYL